MSEKPTTQFSVTGFWLAGLGMIAGLAVVSLLLSWVPGEVFTSLPTLARVGLAVLLTAVPALLWVVIFMRQDRLEPEPREYVAGLFVLGIVAGAGVYRPLFDLLQFAEWGQGNAALIAGFIQGVLLSLLIYAGVRFTIMPTGEFDERVDGMIYSIAFALGIATSEGITLVMSRAVRSYAAVVQIVSVDAMMAVAIGIVVGYVLGMIRPGRANGWLVVAGMLGGGLVWAMHDVARNTISGSLTGNTMLTAIPSLVVMLIVFGLFSWLLTRAYATAADQNDMQLPAGRGDIPVAVVAVVVLVAALLLRGQMTYAGQVVAHGPFQVTMPRGMLPVTPGIAFPKQSLNGVQYNLQAQPSSGSLSKDTAHARLVRGATCRDANTTGEVQVSIGNTPAMIQEYVCLPAAVGQDAIHGYQLFAVADGTLYSISVEGAERSAATVDTYWHELLARLTAK